MKNLLIFGILIILSIQNTFATEIKLNNKSNTDKISTNSNDILIKVEKIFSTFISNSEKKYGKNITLKNIKLLENKIISLLEKQKKYSSKLNILTDLINLSREYITVSEYKNNIIKKSLAFNKFPISRNFSKKILSQDEVFLEDGIWYTYIFKSHLSFPKGITPNLRDLEYNKISTKKHLLFIKKDSILGFVTDYNKVKLISDDIIFGIPNKLQFLKEIRDDKKAIQINSDNDFIQLKNISKKLTKDLYNREDKIQALYQYVLENVEYTQPIVLENMEIFSGLETFKNSDGVCEGYVKYFQYLLQFAGIEDVESIRGFVIDARDYPNIGHAWVRIGEYYYDPTFDDPIGKTTQTTKDEYKYYKLPKDLFYTNRYDFGVDEKILEKAPLNYRKQYVKKNLINIFEKYKNSNYNLLKELQFRNNNNIDYYKKIDIETLKSTLGYNTVNNFQFTENNKSFRITRLNFFTLKTTEDIENILAQTKYNLKDYKLFKWINDDESISYRLGFNIEY